MSSSASSEPSTPTTTPTGGAPSGGSLLSPPTPATPAAPAHTPNRPAPAVWFTAEIQQMMHGMGDCRRPLAESAAIIEDIVHQQMATLLYQSEDVARQRNARFVGIEDFLFLLRKDKVKLRRLLRYLEVRDMKMTTVKSATGEEDETGPEPAEPTRPQKKRRKLCYDFLSSIDQTGELVALFDDEMTDEVKHERNLRAELATRYMDVQQYMEFCEARQASFTPKFKSQRFKDWLLNGLTIDIKPNPFAMEVLSYLAYETVAQVVDLALLVKHDAAATIDDPFSIVTPAVVVSHMLQPGFQTTGVSAGAAAAPGTPQPPTGSTTPSRAPSPLSSPPSTPTTPGQSLSLSGSQSSLLGSSGSTKSKSKKKKKGGSTESKNLLCHDPIQPTEIREAMRRYRMATGPFAAFVKYPMERKHNFLAC